LYFEGCHVDPEDSVAQAQSPQLKAKKAKIATAPQRKESIFEVRFIFAAFTAAFHKIR
jgi:hypothetical protein